MTDYGKERKTHISFAEAISSAQVGWVISRDGWAAGSIVFFAREGTFTAADLVTGHLEPFLVMRAPVGLYGPWSPSQADIAADDWIAITRQAFQRQIVERMKKAEEGDLSRPLTPIEWKDYPTTE